MDFGAPWVGTIVSNEGHPRAMESINSLILQEQVYPDMFC